MKKRRVLILLALLCIGVAVSYGNAVHGEFQFDDDTYISEGAEIRDPGRLFSGGMGKLFAAGTRPVTVLTFALNYAVGGLEVEGYHIMNVVIHLLAMVAVYFLVRRVLEDAGRGGAFGERGEWMALAAAGVFALHPLQTESVTYIVQRGEALASLFYVLGLICMVRFTGSGGVRAWVYWSMGMACFVLGWGSKEIVVTMPAVYLLYVLFFMEKKDMRKAVAGVSPLLVLGAVLGGRVVLSMAGSGSEHAGFGIKGLGAYEYFNTQLRVLVTYVRLIFLPVGQNIDYDYPIYRTVFGPAVLVSLFLWLGAVFMGLYTLRLKGKRRAHCRVMGFGMLWFLAVLAPTSSFVPLLDVIFEHRVYLAMLGIVMSVAAGVDLALVRAREKYGGRGYGRTALYAAAVVLVALGMLTWQRNLVWRTKYTLWADAVTKSPHKARPHNNLGNVYFRNGRYREARAEYRAAIAADPGLVAPYTALGKTYMQGGDVRTAERYFLLSIGMNSAYAEPHLQLGLLDFFRGRYEDAVRDFENALARDPGNPGVYVNAGVAYAELGNEEKAVAYLAKAIELSPGYLDAYINLGKVLASFQRFPSAIEYFSKALEMDPGNADARFHRAGAYIRTGAFDKARREQKRLLRTAPDLAARLEREMKEGKE